MSKVRFDFNKDGWFIDDNQIDYMNEITQIKTGIGHKFRVPEGERVEHDISDFEKSMTPEERNNPILTWSDARIGEGVRTLAKIIGDADGRKSISLQGSAFNFAREMHKSNASTCVCNVEGVTLDKNPLGDYTVIALRTDELVWLEKLKLKIGRWMLGV